MATTSCSCDGYDDNYAWRNWVTSSSTTSSYLEFSPTSSGNDYVWYTWNASGSSTTSSSYVSSYTWKNWVQINETESEETEKQSEERRAREEEDRVRLEQERTERERKYEEFRKAREAAEQKAKQLLLDLIGYDQLKVYEETGRLFVKGKKYDYIIQKEGYVKQVAKDKITDLCIHLKDRNAYPPTDNVIALKLLAEAEEDEFLRMANNCGSDKRPVVLPLAACM